MDINLLALNVGNSRLAIGTFMNGILEHVVRVPIVERAKWGEAISEAWAKIAEMDEPEIAGACVNLPALENVEHIIRQIADEPVQWVGRELDLPIRVKTQLPAETGVDRILNIAAAYESMEKACVVVDAGTAVTVDCCDDAGDFLGGAIAPGLSMMLDALHERTAALPRVTFEPPGETFGTSTESAIRQGVFFAIRGLVRDAAEHYAMELGRWPDIIATGGDAAKLFGGWELIHAVSPDLTLHGIALAYANHHIKHNT